jgi:uncharacterized membrane protein
MSQRTALYELAVEHRLDAAAVRQLHRLAGLGSEPEALAACLPRGVGVLAAALAGLGVILWVAANWDTLGRFGQFVLLQGLVLTLCLAALTLPRARPAFGLMALLSIGGLLAYFGQAYQTGADPWQLFAIWALLCLPLCLATRSDTVWAPWALVAITAVGLWAQAHGGSAWHLGRDELSVYVQAWAAAALLTAGLSTPLRPVTGAGIWALRVAVTLAVALVTLTALAGLIASGTAPRYWLGLLVLGVAAAVLALPRAFDLGSLSAVALGLDTLLVAGLAHWLLNDHQGGEPIGQLLVLGLAAAGLLAATVSAVLRVARHHGRTPADPGPSRGEASPVALREGLAEGEDHE